jgi:Putative prokaryotic signal transducing protein
MEVEEHHIVDIVAKQPNSAGPVTVLETSDPALLAVAKSLLEGEGIEFFAPGEDLQDLFAGGRLGGFNLFVGPVHLQVPADDAARAREVIRDLIDQANNGAPPNPDEDADDQPE